jgi:DNA-binding phage protein
MAETSKFDAANYLKTPEAIAAYLAEAFATDDAAYIAAARDTIERAKRRAVPPGDHFPSA